MNEKEPNSEKKETAPDLSAVLGMGGFLDGVTNLISKFGELAERGETLRQATGETESGKAYQSSMGFSVKFGPGKEGAVSDAMHVAPVNARSNRPPARASTATQNATSESDKGRLKSSTASKDTSPQLREPHVDVYEEADHTLLLAEMPGVATDDLQLRFEGCKLFLEGSSKTALFRAEIELPQVYEAHQVSVTANNGVIEMRLSNQ